MKTTQNKQTKPQQTQVGHSKLLDNTYAFDYCYDILGYTNTVLRSPIGFTPSSSK